MRTGEGTVSRIPDPAAFLKRLFQNVRKEHKYAFLCTMICGLLVHVFMFTNVLLHHDSLKGLFNTFEGTYVYGRWFLRVAAAPSSYFYVPWVTGLLCLLYLSLAAVIIVDILSVKNRLSITLVCLLLVSYPSAAASFAYLHIADAYMLSLLLAVLAVLVTKRWKYGFTVGGVLLCLSMGIYQGYLAFAACLSLYAVAALTLDKDTKLKPVAVQTIRYALMGGIGCAGYYIILKVVLAINSANLLEYQNIDGMGQSITGIVGGMLQNIWVAFRDFFTLGVKVTNGFFSHYGIFVYLFVALAAIGLVCLIYTTKCYKTPWRIIVIGLCIAVLPVCINVVELMGVSDYHLIMRHAYCLVFMFLAWIIDRISAKGTLVNLYKWSAAAVTLALCFCFYLLSNMAYTNMFFRAEKANSMTMRMVDRIEQTEGYTAETPIVFTGTLLANPNYPNHDQTLAPYIDGMTGMMGNIYAYKHVHMAMLLEYYHNLPRHNISDEQFEAVSSSAEVRDMGVFPAEDSVAFIDDLGLIVVKMSEDA